MASSTILGDWGISSCRLHLLDGERVRDGVRGPGIAEARTHPGGIAGAYHDMVAPWEALHGPLPALLCGSVGANIGWVDASYVSAPARLGDFHARRVRTEREGVAILPGVMVEANAFGQPDVMRSEEMQVFGWLARNECCDARLCLPGSHTKWVMVEDAAITGFTSSCTGELFHAIRSATIIAPLRDDGRGPVTFGAAFHDGVDLAAHHTGLQSAIFSIRAEAALGQLSLAESRDRLSGLLVGADCLAMLAVGAPPTAIIGAHVPAGAYRAALLHLGHDVPVADGQDMVLAGLKAVVRQAVGMP